MKNKKAISSKFFILLSTRQYKMSYLIVKTKTHHFEF